MFALGVMEMLLFLAGSSPAPDLVLAIDPAQYFESRQVEVTNPTMVALAGQEPKTAKAQAMQLLALRFLADNTGKLKQDGQYAALRQAVEEVAEGKKAQDAQGFAREYAQLVLARLDGKTPALAAPKLRTGLDWFPASATLVAVLNTRPMRAGPPTGPVTSDLLKKMPEAQRQVLYSVVEKTGNVRVNRFAFAYVQGDQAPRMYVRLTGKANSAWLMDTVKEFNPQAQREDRQNAAGETITLLPLGGRNPTLMFFGATDVMIVGYTHGSEKHEELVGEVLAVRAGKKPNAAAGPLKARLQKVPETAIVLLVGEVPQERRREFDKLIGGTLLKIDGSMEPVPAGLDVRLAGTMTDATEAQAAVTKLVKMRQDGIDMLQKMLKQPDAAPGMPVNTLINLLTSLQMQSEGGELRLRVLLPHEVFQSLPNWFFGH